MGAVSLLANQDVSPAVALSIVAVASTQTSDSWKYVCVRRLDWASPGRLHFLGDAPSILAAKARDEDISTLFRITLDENDVTHDTSGTTISPSGTL